MNKLLWWLRRYWLVLLLLIAFAVLIALSFGELRTVAGVLRRSIWQWILAAILIEAAYLWLYAFEYTLGFAAVQVESNVRQILPVFLASVFVKAVIPTGGVSSLAVFVEDAARRGQSGARAAEGSLLVLVADLAAVAPLIAYGLGYLDGRGMLVLYQTLTTALYFLFTIVVVGILLLGRWFPQPLRRWLAWGEVRTNRLAGAIVHRPVLPAGWAEQQATQFAGAARSLIERPRLVEYTLLAALGGHLLSLGILAAVSLAYGPWLGLGVLTTAYAMNIVFSVISIVPHGLGVAEGVMVLVFTSLGVELAIAVAITVAFRGLSVWLPIFIGFFFVPRPKRRR